MRKASTAPLVKILDGMRAELAKITDRAEELKKEYDQEVSKASSLRRRMIAVQFAIDATTDIPSSGSFPEDAEVKSAILVILREKPLSLGELTEAIKSRGYSTKALRKALTDLAFASIGRGSKARYALRDTIYLDKE